MNQTELIETVRKRTGVRRKDVDQVVTALFDVVTEEVAAGNIVAVTNFVSWTPVERPGRWARNPQTGERVRVAPRRDVRVRALPRFKEIVAGGDPSASRRKRVPARSTLRTEPPEK
ncbi:HU family DNA-binding protein [Streptomyces sp. NPDC093261]|uniref:HU family DNA-binding protein n=1 Tax=Streptomyces sp. NPDC093261 TaxID=3366037 RepID=UPI0037F3984A